MILSANAVSKVQNAKSKKVANKVLSVLNNCGAEAAAFNFIKYQMTDLYYDVTQLADGSIEIK